MSCWLSQIHWDLLSAAGESSKRMFWASSIQPNWCQRFWPSASPSISIAWSQVNKALSKKKCIQESFLYFKNSIGVLHISRKAILLVKFDITMAFLGNTSFNFKKGASLPDGGTRFPCCCRLLPLKLHWMVYLVKESCNREACVRQSSSPYLFILALDPLQMILDRATSCGLLSAIRSRNSLYTEDVTFFNPIWQEVENLIVILENFGGATGLKVNFSKV